MKIVLAFCLSLLSAAPAAAQAPNEIEGAYIACEGVRKACPRTPTPTECTPQRVENCRMIEDAWKALQESQRAANHAKSIDGIAEQLRQKAKP
jgi:hypothetical protein